MKIRVTSSASGPAATIIAGFATATSIALTHTQIAVHPPGPDPGYHLISEYNDPLGLIFLGLGVGAFCGCFRVALEMRDVL